MLSTMILPFAVHSVNNLLLNPFKMTQFCLLLFLIKIKTKDLFLKKFIALFLCRSNRFSPKWFRHFSNSQHIFDIYPPCQTIVLCVVGYEEFSSHI